MLHKQKLQQQQTHYKVVLLSKDTQLYSKEKLHILHEVQLNLTVDHLKIKSLVVHNRPRNSNQIISS